MRIKLAIPDDDSRISVKVQYVFIYFNGYGWDFHLGHNRFCSAYEFSSNTGL